VNKIIPSVLIASITACAAHAGEAKVTWQEPDKYRDIREGNESRVGFREQLFKDFELIFAKLAEQLPDGFLFEVTVTDVDLAGEVNGSYGATWQDIRVIKDLYWPSITFSYTLTDANQALLLAGKEHVRDMGFLSGKASAFKTNRLRYEEKMLKDWFKNQQQEGKFPVKPASAEQPK
jgi:hypothetical protein